jgi:hypothetical protein
MRWFWHLMCRGGWHTWTPHIFWDGDAKTITGWESCQFCPATKAYEDGY